MIKNINVFSIIPWLFSRSVYGVRSRICICDLIGYNYLWHRLFTKVYNLVELNFNHKSLLIAIVYVLLSVLSKLRKAILWQYIGHLNTYPVQQDLLWNIHVVSSIDINSKYLHTY